MSSHLYNQISFIKLLLQVLDSAPKVQQIDAFQFTMCETLPSVWQNTEILLVVIILNSMFELHNLSGCLFMLSEDTERSTTVYGGFQYFETRLSLCVKIVKLIYRGYLTDFWGKNESFDIHATPIVCKNITTKGIDHPNNENSVIT